LILKGYKLSNHIISDLTSRHAPTQALAVVQVGDDPVSDLYVLKKQEMAAKLGINFRLIKLNQDILEEELKGEIEKLNEDLAIRGILVQMPLPAHIDRNVIASCIDPKKDIDGFHCILKSDYFKCLPPTILAIDEILDFYKIDKFNKKILIVGAGFLVGSPLFSFWERKHLDVSFLLSKDQGYNRKLKDADIVVVATGGGREFGPSDFKRGATVIDASTVSDEGKIRGDVQWQDWPEDINLAPVPGGIGPVTVAMLYRNFFDL